MKTTTEPKVQQISLYEEVTNRIISMIENGVAPWRKTWTTYGPARNYVSGRIYTGINYLLMNNTGYATPYFLTFNQVKELGGSIKKGLESVQVIFFKVIYKDIDDNTLEQKDAQTKILKGEDIKVLRFIRYYNVFNIESVEGIDLDLSRYMEAKLSDNQKIERCEQIIKNMPNPPDFKQIDANRAFYDPKDDFINMPDIAQFESSEHFYSTLFHEMIHYTGSEKRLARPEIMDFSGFGTRPYCKEELVAEIGASFLSNIAQIDQVSILENSASYLAGWLKVLKKDSKFIFKVCAEAQKAVDFILG